MKKKILFSVFAIACVCMVSLQMKKSSATISSTDISLSNLEAMAGGEGGDTGCHWDSNFSKCNTYSYSYMCTASDCF